jgi:hypothetical protein
MTTQAQAATGPDQDQTLEEQIQQLRELYADAPEVGKTALEAALPELMSQVSGTPASPMGSAGRAGSQQGTVSELTVIAPFAPGGAERLRALLRLLKGNFDAGKVGSVHDMRFVFLDNDTKLLFCTAYDGDWEPYLIDFATTIPDSLDILFSALEGYPGIRSPEVFDWIAEHQITAEGWYVANPDLTVAETKRLKRVGKELDEFLDKIGS